MTAQHFPNLDQNDFVETRNALHAYSRVLGDWLKACRPKRKHWWHASLRPSLVGLTSDVIHADIDFEIELNLHESLLQVKTTSAGDFQQTLHGQSVAELSGSIKDLLIKAGVDKQLIPDSSQYHSNKFAAYSVEHANNLAIVLNSIATSMELFRANIREETSPIQLWPHHFDLSMLWLPGDKIPDQDPDNEEYADKQMNFGFTFGDEGIPEPYFYITAYPLPEAFPSLDLPVGTTWQTEGFNGAVLLYKTLIQNEDPNHYLLTLWNKLLSAGRENMINSAT